MIADRPTTSIFTDPAAYANEDAWYARAAELRRENGIVRVEDPGFFPFWAVIHHADVHEVGRNAQTFQNAPFPILVGGPARDGGGPPVRNLVGMDGTEHRAFRSIIADWFKIGALRRREAEIDDLVTRELDKLAMGSQEIDFAGMVSAGLPLRFILSTLGVPDEDDAKLHRLADELFGSQDADVARSDNDRTIEAVVGEFAEYFMGLVARRRAEPTDDLGSIIANARIDGRLLEPPDLIPFYILLFAAGHDTVKTVLAGGVEALARFPDQLMRLQTEPALLINGIEEMTRWVTPTKHFMRSAVSDIVVHGQQVRAGDWLLLSYPSANRDEAVFRDPDRFDVARPDAAKHLAYGFGPHLCIGAQLARMQLLAFFRQFVPRVRRLELAGEVRRSQTTFVATFKSVPVHLALI
jgi:cytochrome P450